MIRLATVAASAFRGGAPCCERTRIAGVDAFMATPRNGSPPMVVCVNACTPLGVEHPAIGRFLRGLAAAGFGAIAPELPDVKNGRATPETVEALVGVATAAGPRVAFIGASTGAGLAILAAGDRRLAGRVTAVTAIAPYASLKSLLRLATTGWYAERPFDAAPLVAQATARSLIASASDDPAVPVLLANRDPLRFEFLYSSLRPKTRALVRDLSPVTRMGAVLAPVELLVSPADRFFPVEEAQALAAAGRDVRLTITRGLEHVRPRLTPGLVPVLFALERTLRRAASPAQAFDLRLAAA